MEAETHKLQANYSSRYLRDFQHSILWQMLSESLINEQMLPSTQEDKSQQIIFLLHLLDE